MHPFIHFGQLEIPSYFIMIVLGLIFAFVYVLFFSKTYQVKKNYVLFSSVFIIFGLFIGAKLLYAITVLPDVLSQLDLFRKYPWESLTYLFEGFVFYGGLAGALLFLKMFTIQFDQPFGNYLSLFIPAFPLAHSFGRIGCFLAGCCYGSECHNFLGVTYPDYAIIEGLNLVPRFPTQLFESFFNLFLFLFLLFWGKKAKYPNQILGIYLIFYGVFRFTLEFFRGDLGRGIFFNLSTSQWLSFLAVILGFYFYKKKAEHLK